MLYRKICLILIFIFTTSLFTMEEGGEIEPFEEIHEHPLIMQMLPYEIFLIILEFVLEVNPKSIKAKDIFDAFDEAKLNGIISAKNFALTCTYFNNFKGRFAPFIKKNIKHYLAQNWSAEYLGKSIEELNEELKKIFIDSEDQVKNSHQAAKLICAGASPNTAIKYKRTDKDIECPLVFYAFIKLSNEDNNISSRLSLFLFFYNVKCMIKDENGDTVLIFASAYNNISLVRKLLRLKDINVDHKNNKGYTALDCAQANEHKEIADMLIKAKAIENIDAANKLLIFIKAKEKIAGFNMQFN